ncbi:MAG: hypothetical protein U9N78_01255, partial [Actinomycetota bacterium]|nr:hypothetical protein [Actinomycetota bacterium]
WPIPSMSKNTTSASSLTFAPVVVKTQMDEDQQRYRWTLREDGRTMELSEVIHRRRWTWHLEQVVCSADWP